MKLRSYGLSDVGRKRTHNEDSLLDNQKLGLFAVADGMGGHNAGEVASRLAVDTLATQISEHTKLLETFAHGPTPRIKRQILDMLDHCVQKACQHIYETAQSDAGKQGMGTTLSVLLVVGRSAFVAHVGDSRVYLIRKNEVHPLTEDHTLVQEQVRKGLLTPEEAVDFPYKNVITRGVGLLQRVQVDTLHMETSPGDRFLLCSDGLYEYLSNEEIQSMFDQQSLEDITRRLIELANGRGGKDNLTALAVELPDLPFEGDEIEVNRKLDALRQIHLFEQLSYSELVKVLNIARIEKKQKGSIIIREGDMGDCMYIIVHGSVDILKDSVYLTTLKRGRHFGEMSLVDNDVRSATVRASSDCDLLTIERSDFYTMLREEPHLSVKILVSFVNILSMRLRDTTRAFSESRRRIAEINAAN